jgi:hypothetical protein
MKGKNLLCLAILATLIVGAMPLSLIPTAKASPTTYYFDPASLHWTSVEHSIGETFNLVIRVDTIPDLYMWVLDVEWDPDAFDLISWTEGMALKQTGATVFTYAAQSDGFLDDLTCASMEGKEAQIPPMTYNDLVTLTFKTEKYIDPSSPTYIRIPWAIWVNVAGQEKTPEIGPPFEFTFEHVLYTTPPVARFSPSTCEYFYVNEPVTFNASLSSPGYDGDEPTPITEYRWDFDGVPGWEVVTSDPVTTWTFDTTGDKSVTLEVYAPGIPPVIGDDYVPTDQETHTIHLIERVLVGIDVYTERNGIGYHVPSDAFGPQEEITVYAKVTYGGEGVAYKPVGFEVKDNNGTVVLTRTVFTDMNGECNFTFRIPWTGMEAEKKFGTWTIYGTVDIAEVRYEDYCRFNFGYIVSILSIRTTDVEGNDKNSFGKGEEVYVELTLRYISFNSKTVYITVTIYDNEGVPIGFMPKPTEVIPPGENPFWNFGILIPYWRFKGVGTVYVNLFTAMPHNGGVPYCPEKSVPITLS